jgi:Domain of unknown function (DUF305)
MSFWNSRGRPAAALIACALSGGTLRVAATGDEAPFLAENDAAMTRMMSAMAVKPSGDVDKDFVAVMVPHHQGAIDMAQAELRHGHNEQLRRLAQEIIVEQTQEIAVMRLALTACRTCDGPTVQPPPAAAPDEMTGPGSSSGGERRQ